MVAETALLSMSIAIAELVDRRSSQWRDSAGYEFEARFLRPLGDTIEEFQRIVAQYEQEVRATLGELGGG